jgi:hypothetical protein
MTNYKLMQCNRGYLLVSMLHTALCTAALFAADPS